MNNMDTEYVFQGPRLLDSPICSLSEYLLPKISKLDTNRTFLINAETEEQLTVKEFLSLSLKLAGGLEDRNIGPGDVVVSIGLNSTDLLTVMMGSILQCAPYFALDPSLKEMEISRIFRSCEPKIVFADKDVLDTVLSVLDELENVSDVYVCDSNQVHASSRVHHFQEILKDFDPNSFEPKSVDDPKSETAIMYCTSGTTGLPKVVELTHVNCIYGVRSFPSIIDANVTFLQTTHSFWISSYIMMCNALSQDVKIVYLTNVDADRILQAIDRFKPSSSFIPPIYLKWIVTHVETDKYDLSSLKYILVAGASLPKATIRLLGEKLPNAYIQPLYGCTELSGTLTRPCLGRSESAGQLTGGVKAKVMDLDTGKPLGPNQEGELIFSTPGLMKGYLKDREATAEVIDSQGFFHTGDIGYITEDGFVFVTNRIKDVIKYRLHAISPSEIEEVILRIEGVKDVAVVGVPDEVDYQRPAAVVVREQGSDVSEEKIKDFVANILSPTKQLYGGVRFVDSIPRNSNGKVTHTQIYELLGVPKHSD